MSYYLGLGSVKDTVVDSLTHAIDFRTVLHEPRNITEFRREFFGDPLWSVRLQPGTMVRAVVNRTAVASIVQVPPAGAAATGLRPQPVSS